METHLEQRLIDENAIQSDRGISRKLSESKMMLYYGIGVGLGLLVQILSNG